MAERYFTPEEANEALAVVRPLAERMVAHHRRLGRATARRAELSSRISGDGGALDPRRPAQLQEEIEREAQAIGVCLEELHELGVLVKDLELGLVDFPALHDDDVVLLCWRIGEDEVGFWHGLAEGFAGRKPLPLP